MKNTVLMVLMLFGAICLYSMDTQKMVGCDEITTDVVIDQHSPEVAPCMMMLEMGRKFQSTDVIGHSPPLVTTSKDVSAINHTTESKELNGNELRCMSANDIRYIDRDMVIPLKSAKGYYNKLKMYNCKIPDDVGWV